jgi:hypothetical protein
VITLSPFSRFLCLVIAQAWRSQPWCPGKDERMERAKEVYLNGFEGVL